MCVSVFVLQNYSKGRALDERSPESGGPETTPAAPKPKKE